MGPKARMTSLDVTCMTEELRPTVLGWRLSNVYDLDEKTYQMKFAVPGESEKINILIESGIRFHRTFYQREKSLTPSNFTMKLRKHLRGKRLEGLDQLGTDRVVDLRFGSGDTVSHLVVELYSNGNIVLTDGNYLVQALLRSHQFDEDVVLKVGEFYPLNYTTKTLVEVSASQEILAMDVAGFVEFAKRREQEAKDWHNGPANEKSKRKLKKMYVKQLLMNKESGVSHYSGEIIEHCILCAGLDISAKVEDIYGDEGVIKALLEALEAGSGLVASNKSQKGSMSAEKSGNSDAASPSGYIFVGREDGAYTEFCSLLLRQHEGKPEEQKITFSSFGEAVDEYFAKVETQKMDKCVADAEKAAQAKIEKVRQAREGHIHSLVTRQEHMELSAKLVEYHAEDVDKVALVLNSCLNNAMDWDSIGDMVDQETAAGNAIAGLICGLNLAESKASLRLRNVFLYDSQSDEEHGDDEDGESGSGGEAVSEKARDEKEGCEGNADKWVEVEVDLTKSAYANAREMFGDKKSAVSKEKKAIDASYSAMASVEKAMERKLESQRNQKALQAVRHIHWFEKFNWFITSEGYLVISGRDAAQCEQIVLRHMRPGDILVHSESKGAFPCVLRHKPIDGHSSNSAASNSVKISPFAIHEAAHSCVNRSAAWSSKIMASAWWVWGREVVAPESGDYARMGTFLVKGKKNLLPPQSMEMGFGIIFRVDEESAARHASEKKDRAHTIGVEAESVMNEAASRYGLEELDEAISLPMPPLVMERGEGKGEGEGEGEGEVFEPIDSEGERKSEKGPSLSSVPAPPSAPATALAPASKAGKSDAKAPAPAKKGGKKLNKKKARRYAEQDEEDRELAMHALGHAKPGNKLKDKLHKKKQEEEEREQERKARRAGTAQFVKEQEEAIFAAVPEGTRKALDMLVEAGLIEAGEIAKEEVKVLSGFVHEEALEVLALFEEALRSHKGKTAGNISGYLAGIMRRYITEKDKKKRGAREDLKDTSRGAADAGASPGHQATNCSESEEMRAFLAEQASAEAESSEVDVDDTRMFTASPRDGDVILYALPFCGPYASMRDFKYKAKLLPGPLKKSKGVKTCMEFFMRLPQCKGQERAVIEGMRDGETTALMMPEVKVSMPGLQAVKQAVKQVKKKQRGEKQRHGR